MFCPVTSTTATPIPPPMAAPTNWSRAVVRVAPNSVCTTAMAVIAACGEARPDRPETWINGRIRAIFSELFALGHVHTVECWREGRLVGGLYGLSLGGAFFGESMFHRETDASKVALVHLVARLRRGGYRLLDTQFQTGHLAQFGTIEIPRDAYRPRLDDALRHRGNWHAWPARAILSGSQALAEL